ncbi:MAG TPA: hypothetical protein VHK88_06770 [Aquihabitans sp.]|jgi:hypothetical protein|nr:hypothetical protein [Aquihabitans sp.]
MVTLALVAALLAGGCSDADDGEDARAGSSTTAADRPDGDGGGGGGGGGSVTTEEPGVGACDDTDPAACLLPWPNDRFTRADATTATGRRLDLPAEGMPATGEAVRMQPAEWNRNDGFSPASSLVTVVPDLDPEASALPPVTDIGASLDEGSSLVLVDLDTGERVAAWAELDANSTDPDEAPLLIVPAALLAEGHRHAVGLRGLRRTDGSEVEPTDAFADLVASPDAAAEAWLGGLADAGVDVEDLDIAWSFTVGSAEDLSGRLRHMWSETSEELGDGAPAFEVTSDEEQGGARVVRGTFEAPNYLEGDGGPGSNLANEGDPDGLPTRTGERTTDFTCTVPASAGADDPTPSLVYGHGLLGSRDEVLGLGSVATSVNITSCAVDWIGMSSADIPNVIATFDDLTTFRSVPDRLQQGHLEFLLLGRLLRSDEGFAADPAFQDDGGRPLLDPDRVAFLGASQGGILGGASSALTEDWTRVVLAVPGVGYNLLLRRSIDFDRFAPLIEEAYPDELDQVIVLEVIQQLWQRGENAAYAQHLAEEPYDGAPAKDVLLLEAFGDHQVANVSTERLARTLGIGRRAPTLAEGRSTDEEPFWGIEPIEDLPHDGSGLVVWDFGTPAPPTENVPPRAGEDPHGKLADVPEALALVAAFIEPDGELIDVCDGEPCATP